MSKAKIRYRRLRRRRLANPVTTQMLRDQRQEEWLQRVWAAISEADIQDLKDSVPKEINNGYSRRYETNEEVDVRRTGKPNLFHNKLAKAMNEEFKNQENSAKTK